MAKLSNTQVYGHLGVANTITCQNLYIDRLGSALTNGLNIGDISSDSFVSIATSGLSISLDNAGASYVSSFFNRSGNVQYSMFGAGTNSDGYSGHVAIGTEGSAVGDRYGIIRYSDANQTSGQLIIENTSTVTSPYTAATKIIVGTNTAITITEEKTIICGGTEGISYNLASVADPIFEVASDGTMSFNKIVTFQDTTVAQGPLAIGFATGATPSTSRLYFNDGNKFMQYDPDAEDGAGALQYTDSIAMLFTPTTQAEVTMSTDGFLGPQIGWVPAWFDDFNNDHLSEYTLSGSYDTGYPNVSTERGTLRIQQADFEWPVGYTGYSGNALYFPLKLQSEFLHGNKHRYFVMRYLNRTVSGDEPFKTGYIAWKKNTDAGWSATNRYSFELVTAATKSWYWLWLDMYDAGSAWSGGTSSSYVTDLMIHLDDPVSGAGGNTANISVDYWGFGHRGFESRFNSSDVYFWSDAAIEGSLAVTGDTTMDMLTADTMFVGHIDFDTTHVPEGPTEGRLEWNDDDGTLNLGMPGGDVTLQLGQELIVRVRNSSGVDILNGQVVKNVGSSGNRPTIELASANSAETPTQYGMATENILDGNNGYVCLLGSVRGIDTSAWAEGTSLYLSDDPLSAGTLVSGTPSAPNHRAWIGVVTNSHASEGSVYIKPEVPMNIHNLSDVNGTTPDSTNKYLVWQDGSGYWDSDVIYHTGLTGLQGGTTDEYYHLDLNDYMNLTGYSYASEEPTGFINTNNDSVLTWYSATNTLEITPTGSTFDVMVDGVLFQKTGDTIVISGDYGLHHVVYSGNGEILDIGTGATVHDFIVKNAFVSYVYFDADSNTAVGVGDERHGALMDAGTHAYLHQVFGSRYISGFAPYGLTADGSGNDDQDAVIGVESGVFFDEDVTHNQSGAATGATIPIIYISGSSVLWRYNDPRIHPILTGGTGRMVYNELNGGNWQLTEISNNAFGLTHIFATNEIRYPIVSIVGQAEYNTISNARLGAVNEISSLVTEGLPYAEFTPIGTFIYQTSNSYGNQSKSRLRTTDEGDEYIDWRTAEISPSAAAGDHGSLGGLGDDDHVQYHTDERAEIQLTGTVHDTFTASTLFADSALYVNAGNTSAFSNAFFHNGTTQIGASLSFDQASSQFNISHATNFGGGYLATDGNGAGFNLYLNTNAASTTTIWFGNSDGSYNTHSLTYDTTENFFEFSHPLNVNGLVSGTAGYFPTLRSSTSLTTGTLSASSFATIDGNITAKGNISCYGNLVLNSDNTASDTRLDFDGTASARLKYDYDEFYFNFSKELRNDQDFVVGTNSFTGISSSFTAHTADTTIHFTEGSIDHGSIGGLADDDHTQYHNDTRAEDWLTGNTHDVVTADTIVVNTGITYPNGVWRTEKLDIGGNIGGTWNWTQAVSVAAGNNYHYAYMQCALTTSAATPAATAYLQSWWHVPENWISGTPITFDYYWGVSSWAGGTTAYVDIYMTASTHTFNPVGDESNYLGREYSTTRSQQITVTGMSCYSQTFKKDTGIVLTSDGTMGSGVLSPGDQVVLKWWPQQSTYASPGATFSTYKMMYIVMHYLSSE